MTLPPEVVIGVDVGTTAAKVSAFAVGGTRDWRHVEVREYPLLHPRPGWEVQDPAAVWDAVRTALHDCVRACGAARVLGLGVSTAMHGLLGLDASWRPLGDLVTWADTRAADLARGLRHDPQVRRIAAETGTPLHPFSPLFKLAWTGQHAPDVAARVHTWVSLKGWVLLNLTGELVEELGSASSSGLYDISRRQWHAEALALAGVPAAKLPPVVSTTTALPIAPDVASAMGLPVSTPVVVGAGDGPLGNLGVGALAPGVAGLSLGTSGALRLAVPGPVVDRDPGLFCYALTDEVWTLGGAISNGGLVLRWAASLFDLGGDPIEGDASADAAALRLAETVAPGAEGLVMIPYLLGERAPLWDPDLPGAWLGVRHGHGAGHFIRAAVEGVGRQLGLVADLIAKVQPIDQVRATGGVFRAGLWRDVVAASLERPLVVTAGAEGSGLGAAVLALLGVGRVADLAAGLELLEPPHGEDATHLASPELVAAQRRQRVRIAPLLAAYDELLPLLEPVDRDVLGRGAHEG